MDYTEQSAKSRVTRNGGKISGAHIHIKRPGLKVLSAIDYLEKKHGYFWIKEEADGKT